MQSITVNSKCIELQDNYDVFALFECLRKQYSEDQLFLLESLSGPKRDIRQAAIGFNPVLGVEFHRDKLKLLGSSKVCQKINDAIVKNVKGLQKLSGFEYGFIEERLIWDILRQIEACFEVKYQDMQADLNFGFFGYVGYDVVHAIEKIPYSIADDKNIPLISFNIYQGIFTIDLQKQKSFLTLNYAMEFEALSFDKVSKILSENYNSKLNAIPNSVKEPTLVKDSITKQDYFKAVKKALHHIGQGDIYQIQLGHEITIETQTTPVDVYKRLRHKNPSPYMYYTKLSNQHIIGASPELFLRIDKDNKVTMRPIAGTIKVSQDAEENRQLQQKLLNDEKERAEHIMLVDLCRNDIGRICKKNTMVVDELMVIEQYSHVSHIVSNVYAIKDDKCDKYTVFSAGFPAGTMSGAPKIRAMEIIEDTETTRRGIYAGSVGYIGFNGIVETALCIRTAFYKDQTYIIRASGGVVYDSTPEGEWQETISKLSANYYAITNKELRDESFID